MTFRFCCGRIRRLGVIFLIVVPIFLRAICLHHRLFQGVRYFLCYFVIKEIIKAQFWILPRRLQALLDFLNCDFSEALDLDIQRFG